MDVTDYTDEWVSLFRKNGKGMGFPDSAYLDMALAFGKPNRIGEMSTVGKYYRKPDVKVAKKLLKSMHSERQKNLVSPGEPVGIHAAHSISEVFTQSTLRTFHYAGLVGTLEPGKWIEKVIDIATTMDTRHTVALKPEYRNNYAEAKRIAHKLERWKLEDLFYVDLLDNVDTEYEELLNELDSFPENERYVDLPDNHPIVVKRKKLYGDDFDPSEDRYDPYNYSPEYQALVDRKREYYEEVKRDIDKLSEDNAYGNQIVIKPKFDSQGQMSELGSDVPPYFMTLEELKPQLERSLEYTSTGERKYSDMAGWSFASISIINNGNNITITIPRGVFPRKSIWAMALNFYTLLVKMEMCGGCGDILTGFTKGEVKDRSTTYAVDEAVDETAKEHYKKILSSIGSETVMGEDVEFFDEDYLSAKANPDSGGKDIEEIQNSASGMIKLPPSPPDMFFVMCERYVNWRNCRNCGGGWWNTAAGVAQVHDYFMDSMDEAIAVSLASSDDTKNPQAYMAYENLAKYPYAWKEHQFEPPSPDIDYSPIATMIDSMPSNPLPGEYYLEVKYKEEITSDNSWKGSVFCCGHFSHLVGQFDNKGNYHPPTLLEADPSRCITTNLLQVEKTLGVEAARQMLFQSLSQLYCGGQYLGGFDTRINDKHMMLLADLYTNTGTLLGAPTSRASLSGVVASKGLRGKSSSIIAQASYERPLDVIMKKIGAAAPMGVVDPLDEPMSAQVVGVEMKIGSGTHPDRGRYSLEELFDARDASSAYDLAMERLVDLFMAPGRSLNAAENLMGMPETDERYPRRIFESDEYKEARQVALDAKKEWERLHGVIVGILGPDNI
jgi:hypothetical protein